MIHDILNHPILLMFLVSVLVIVIYSAALFDHSRMTREQEILSVDLEEARRHILAAKKNPDAHLEFHHFYAFAVRAAKERFPLLKVWGEHIQNNTGYAVFFTDGKIPSCWQVRATISVNSKNHKIDLLDAQDIKAEVNAALEAVKRARDQYAMAHG